MGQRFVRGDRDQELLLPPSLREWLPDGHLAWFVIETVERLDLSAITSAYRADGHGRPPYDPAMMTALLIYNYAVGVRSSRQVERRLVEDVACRVIAVNLVPDHSTIAEFRARHQDAISGLFCQVLALCQQAGMGRVGMVAVDSTKLAGDASLGANRGLKALRELAGRALKEAAETDAAEDELYGQARGDELPPELADPATRGKRIDELLAGLEAREQEILNGRQQKLAREADKIAQTGRKLSGKPPSRGLSVDDRRAMARLRVNLTDPDSGIVRHRGMLLQGYNIQTAVADGQIILAATATSQSPDSQQLAPALHAAAENLRAINIDPCFDTVLADTGYWHAGQIDQLKSQGLNVLVPPRPGARQPAALTMADTLAGEPGKRAYRRRQQIVEPVFAHIKHHRQITRLLRRGKHAVQAEIDLIATTHNLLKLFHATPNPA
jgi:transposase